MAAWDGRPECNCVRQVLPRKFRVRDCTQGKWVMQVAANRRESVASEGKTRKKQARKRSLLAVNEHSEPVFDAGLPSAVAFTVIGRALTPAGEGPSMPRNPSGATVADATPSFLPRGRGRF